MSTCATCVTSSISLSLLIGGIAFLVLSFQNHRQERVSEYNDWVDRWNSTGRGKFESAQINVTAVMVDRTRVQTMEASETLSWTMLDSEAGQGVKLYTPLKYVTVFQMPSSYTNGTRAEDGSFLPPEEEDASTAVFQFLSVDKNGTRSQFESTKFAVAYNTVAATMTPAPHLKCRSVQHGIWQGGRCYHVQRLAEVCLQVDISGDDGWRLRTRGGGEAPKVRAYGCDHKNGWEPAKYQVDKCWASDLPAQTCSAVDLEHWVQVTLRSSEDPLFEVEELTHDTFDFGIGRVTQRVYAGALLALGCCLSAMPLIQIYQRYYGTDDDDEDCRSFTAAREDPTEFGRSL